MLDIYIYLSYAWTYVDNLVLYCVLISLSTIAEY